MRARGDRGGATGPRGRPRRAWRSRQAVSFQAAVVSFGLHGVRVYRRFLPGFLTVNPVLFNLFPGLGVFSAFFVWRIFFSRVTPEPGLQFHANVNQTRRDVIRRPPPKEHDLRLLRKALFPGRY